MYVGCTMAFYSKWDNGERATAVVLCIAAVSWFGLVSWLDPLGNMFDQVDKVVMLDFIIDEDYNMSAGTPTMTREKIEHDLLVQNDEAWLEHKGSLTREKFDKAWLNAEFNRNQIPEFNVSEDLISEV
jgi:hypothetical protein